MVGSYHYAHEKLISAVHALAVGAGDVRERLLAGFMTFHPVTRDDFPESMRADWDWIMGQLTRFGPILDGNGGISRGAVENTMQKIQRTTGVKIAERIVQVHDKLESWVREHDEP